MFRLTLLAASLAVPLPAIQQPAAQEPSFRVDVKLVNVVATVKDSSGAPIGGLERDDFTLLADSASQQIAIFERQTDRPLTVLLLFDASPSVVKELKFEQEAALRFMRSLLGPGAHPADRVAVCRFHEYVEEVIGFTNSLPQLERALLSIRMGKGTSVYDALYLAAQKLEEREGRKVIIIITDGGDTTSRVKYTEALEAAQLADAVVYSIIVVPISNDAGRNLGGENALKSMSAATGGLAFLQYSERELDQTFREIERDLRTQYLIGFYPSGIAAGQGRFHRIELRVSRPGVRVLARSGYFTPPDEEAARNYEPGVTIEGGPPRERKKEDRPSPPARKIPRSVP